MMNMNPNAKPLIFTNLPFEIEAIILGYYREIRANRWNETLRMFSSKKLARELYRQSECRTIIQKHLAAHIHLRKREMFDCIVAICLNILTMIVVMRCKKNCLLLRVMLL